jgi:hypothetical protein
LRRSSRLLAIRDQVVPPTLNLDNPDPASAGVDIVHGQARPMPIEYALSNGFGFGGSERQRVVQALAGLVVGLLEVIAGDVEDVSARNRHPRRCATAAARRPVST